MTPITDAPVRGLGTMSSDQGERIAVALIAIASALPSVLGGFVGTGFLSDDWAVWLVFERLGVIDGMWQLAFEQPARPLAAPYYALQYVVIGDHAVAQTVLIGLVNASLIVAAWLCGRRFLPPTVLWPALVVFALAPNHAMTRLWYVVGTYPLALALVLLALREVDRGRVRRSAVLLVAAVLLYEGVAALAVGGLLLWAGWPPARSRLRTVALVAGPTIIVTGAMFLASPKRSAAGANPFENVASLLPAQVGVGFWGNPVLGQLGGSMIMLGFALALVHVVRSGRQAEPEAGLAVVGVLLAGLGAAPFVFAGATFGTTGVFDRNNLVAGVGVALLLGALWALLRLRSAGLAAAVGVVCVASFAIAQVHDVRRFADAVSTGDAIVAQLAETSGVDDRRPVLVVPEQASDGTGLAAFIYDGDLTGALRYRHGGDWSRVHLVERAHCPTLEGWPRVQIYNWRTMELEVVPGTEAAAVCRDGRIAPS